MVSCLGSNLLCEKFGPVGWGEPISIPTPKCAKITKRVREASGLQPMQDKQLMPHHPSPVLLFITKFKDQDRENKLSVPPSRNKKGTKWKFIYPVGSIMLCNMLLHCHLLVVVSIEPCLPLKVRNRTAELILELKAKDASGRKNQNAIRWTVLSLSNQSKQDRVFFFSLLTGIPKEEVLHEMKWQEE